MLLKINCESTYVPALLVDDDLERLEYECAEEGVEEEELPDGAGEWVGEDGPVEVLVRLAVTKEDGVRLRADWNLESRLVG